jgi:hypothetical protein
MSAIEGNSDIQFALARAGPRPSTATRASRRARVRHPSSTEGRVGSPAERLVSARSAKCAHPLARAMKMPRNSAETFAASIMHSAASRLYSSAVGTRFTPSLCLSTQFGNPGFVPSGTRLEMGSFRVVTSGGPRVAHPLPAAAEVSPSRRLSRVNKYFRALAARRRHGPPNGPPAQCVSDVSPARRAPAVKPPSASRGSARGTGR